MDDLFESLNKRIYGVWLYFIWIIGYLSKSKIKIKILNKNWYSYIFDYISVCLLI